MSSNLYDSLPQSIRKMLDGTDLEDAAKRIDAEVAEQQAKVYADKLNTSKEVERFKEEYTKVKGVVDKLYGLKRKI